MSEATAPLIGITAQYTPHPFAATGAEAAGPVQPKDRNALLDVLRGVALLGILQANWDNVSGGLQTLIAFAVSGSFYPMFSLLFGLGFAMQLVRAEQARRPFVARYLWRTAILFCIGTVHAAFIWDGDILRVYAIAALALLLMHKLRLTALIILAAIALAVSGAPIQPNGYLFTRVDPERVVVERFAQQSQALADAAHPPVWCQVIPGLTQSYRDQVCSHANYSRALLARHMWSPQWWISLEDYPGLLAMFLLGLYVGRRRILHEVERHRRYLLWSAGVALVIGIAGSAQSNYEEVLTANGIGLPTLPWGLGYSLGNVGLMLFYVSGITLVFTYSRFGRRVLTPLADVGRMGLTNYLVQSIVFAIILGSAGFDIMDGIEGWRNLLLINAFFVVQVVYSHWWFRHFAFGPVEWLWRSLTWFRMQPMRISVPAGVQPAPGG